MPQHVRERVHYPALKLFHHLQCPRQLVIRVVRYYLGRRRPRWEQSNWRHDHAKPVEQRCKADISVERAVNRCFRQQESWKPQRRSKVDP